MFDLRLFFEFFNIRLDFEFKGLGRCGVAPQWG